MNKVGGLILSFFVCTSCTTVADVNYLSPRQLYNLPEMNGRPVAVRGYITNGRCLYQSRRRFSEFISEMRRNSEDFNPADFDDDGLTILGPRELLDHRRQLESRDAFVRGTFVSNYLDGRVLDTHACGRAAIVIDEEELRRLINSSSIPGSTVAPAASPSYRPGGTTP